MALLIGSILGVLSIVNSQSYDQTLFCATSAQLTPNTFTSTIDTLVITTTVPNYGNINTNDYLIQVFLNFKHSQIGELSMTLSHNNKSIVLFDNIGSGYYYFNSYIYDDADSPISFDFYADYCFGTYGCHAQIEDYSPSYNLQTQFENVQFYGDWVLTIEDNNLANNNNVDSISGFCMQFIYAITVDPTVLPSTTPTITPTIDGTYSPTVTVNYEDERFCIDSTVVLLPIRFINITKLIANVTVPNLGEVDTNEYEIEAYLHFQHFNIEEISATLTHNHNTITLFDNIGSGWYYFISYFGDTIGEPVDFNDTSDICVYLTDCFAQIEDYSETYNFESVFGSDEFYGKWSLILEDNNAINNKRLSENGFQGDGFLVNFCMAFKRVTLDPTIVPSNQPTVQPSDNPSTTPSIDPSVSPTKFPTTNPSNYPTVNPTVNPTKYPSTDSTNAPSVNPTDTPSKYPSVNPTVNPTLYPTNNPSQNPTNNPTSNCQRLEYDCIYFDKLCYEKYGRRMRRSLGRKMSKQKKQLFRSN